MEAQLAYETREQNEMPDSHITVDTYLLPDVDVSSYLENVYFFNARSLVNKLHEFQSFVPMLNRQFLQ